MASFYIQLENKLQKISGDLTPKNIIKALGYTPSNFSGSFNDLKDNPFIDNLDKEFTITDELGNIIAKVDSTGIHSIDFIAGEHKLSTKVDAKYVDEKILDVQLNGLDAVIPVKDVKVNNKSVVVNSIANIDLTNYAKLENIPVVPSLDGYAKLTDIPSLEGYAKTEDIPSLDGYAKLTDIPIIPSLDEYATKEYVNSKLENVTSSNPSTNKYATKEELYQIALEAIESIPLKDDESSEFNIVDANGNIGLKLNSSGLYVKDVIANGHILSNKVDKTYVEQLVLDNTASTDDIDTLFENKNILTKINNEYY